MDSKFAFLVGVIVATVAAWVYTDEPPVSITFEDE